MPHKRDGFVPLGDIAGTVELPGDRALTPAAPEARHHFTRLDQINQLVDASEADADLGFMARLLALCSLPRTNPGDRLQYKRVNGPVHVGHVLKRRDQTAVRQPASVAPGVGLHRSGTDAKPRAHPRAFAGRLHAGVWVSTTMAALCGRRLRNQMQRLFRSHVELVYEDAHGSRFVNSAIADSGEFWWDTKHPDQSSLWESKIELGEKFFHEVITNPIPLDLNILKRLKRSPLGLDLYLWLTYRTFGLTRQLRLTWPLLYRQFGVDPARAGEANTVQNFRRDCLRELKKIKMAWPDLHYQTVKGALLLSPSTPRIPPAQLRLVE